MTPPTNACFRVIIGNIGGFGGVGMLLTTRWRLSRESVKSVIVESLLTIALFKFSIAVT